MTESVPEPSTDSQETFSLEDRAFLARVTRTIDQIKKDPEAEATLMAFLRTCTNLGITLADFIPIAGGSLSLGADLAKVLSRIKRFGRVLGVKLDLTPDVSLWLAGLTEGLEIPTAGFFPTHGFETLAQFRHDLPRMKTGLINLVGILSHEWGDYFGHQPEIDQAMETFEVSPPDLGEKK